MPAWLAICDASVSAIDVHFQSLSVETGNKVLDGVIDLVARLLQEVIQRSVSSGLTSGANEALGDPFSGKTRVG